MKSGLVYKAGKHVPEVKVARVIWWLKLFAKIFSGVGLVCIALGVGLAIFIFAPLVSVEVKYWLAQKVTSEGPAVSTVIAPVTVEKPDWDVPDENYSVNIPKIAAISRVITNVDIANPKEYGLALKEGVAEAANLAHPGEKGTTYLFAHSVGDRIDFARYNAVFYLLDKLKVGDSVEVVYQKKLYRYRVEYLAKLAPNDTTYLVPQKDEEKLVLQTCYPPGTAWWRLIVVAKRV